MSLFAAFNSLPHSVASLESQGRRSTPHTAHFSGLEHVLSVFERRREDAGCASSIHVCTECAIQIRRIFSLWLFVFAGSSEACTSRTLINEPHLDTELFSHTHTLLFGAMRITSKDRCLQSMRPVMVNPLTPRHRFLFRLQRAGSDVGVLR